MVDLDGVEGGRDVEGGGVGKGEGEGEGEGAGEGEDACGSAGWLFDVGVLAGWETLGGLWETLRGFGGFWRC